MAQVKITGLTELTTPAVGDYLPIVDVSDTTDSAQGTTKKITLSKLGATQVGYKSSDETINNSTTFQNDDAVLFAIGSNEVWRFYTEIYWNSGATPDLKFQWSLPSGATMYWTDFFNGNTVNTEASTEVMTGAGAIRVIYYTGVVFNSTNAGNVNLQWAQNTQDPTDSKVLAGSYIIATRLA